MFSSALSGMGVRLATRSAFAPTLVRPFASLALDRRVLFSTASRGLSTEAATIQVDQAKATDVEADAEQPAARVKKTPTARQQYTVEDALAMIAQHKERKFDETIEIIVETGLDPRKPNQSIRSTLLLPNKVGEVTRVCVFAEGAEAEAAVEAGAQIVGGMDLIKRIKDEGFLAFDRCIATPLMMPKVAASIGRILGPRDLMPNPKTNTVTEDVGGAVKLALGGAMSFRNDRTGSLRAGVAKRSWGKDATTANIRAFMMAVSANKPKGARGKYIQKIYLGSTMGKSYRIFQPNIDPSSPRFMRPMESVPMN